MLRIFAALLLGLVFTLPVQSDNQSYGPIAENETLWVVAEKLLPDNGITVQQMMLAIYRKNTHAFAANNINSLMKGAYLIVPDAAEARELGRVSASKEAQRQYQRWKAGKYSTNRNRALLPEGFTPPATRETAGSGLPETEPDAVKAAAVPDADTAVPAVPAVVAARPATASGQETTLETVKRLRTEVATLKDELAATKAENERLLSELTILRSVQAEARVQQAPVDEEIAKQVRLLESELNELKSILGAKDNHIKTLQANLKSASEAIKSQHADNMRLYNLLKQVSPSSLPTEAAPDEVVQPQLTLAAVEPSPALSDPDSQTGTPVQAPENPAHAAGAVWADQVSPQAGSDRVAAKPEQSQPIRLSQIVPATSASSGDGIMSSTVQLSMASVSPLAWGVALLSFLFVVYTALKAFLQHRAMVRLDLETAWEQQKQRQEALKSRAQQDIVQAKPDLVGPHQDPDFNF
ncbi:MAG: hypothetical protein KDI44_05170 [Thiothrix sp.]|nr:hypothetical protein [Thiothrix sp.]HPQ94927.1 FimV/HubP family polar landmark protein [Thiolinea sp.]